MNSLQVQRLGNTDYVTTWRAMQTYTAQRDADSADVLWLTQHPPVYTLGLNRRAVRLPTRDDIPLIQSDRGGKITYHGPGQVVLYYLLDLQRRGLTVRELVHRMESAVIALLRTHGITAQGRKDAPGVYVGAAKIASLGLRLKQGRCYHGLSLNVDMDLAPFRAIDPCGQAGLMVTQLRDLGVTHSSEAVGERLLECALATFHA